MDTLWATWRSKYIDGFKDEKTDPANNPCFICEAAQNSNSDKELLVVARRKYCFVMLNKYPYNGGHILVSPYRHIGEFDKLSDEELLDIMHTIRESTNIINEISKPQGFNIGANIGREAGAGMPSHIHFHVVPRWNGDTSFMSVLFETKVISQSLQETQKLLYDAFAKSKYQIK